MPKYMLLLYSDPNAFRNLSPEQMQKATEKYMAWTKRAGTLDGKRLGDDVGKVVRPNNGNPRTTDGPYSETKEVLAGYYLIEAENYDEALKATIGHPHLEVGGTIEVRHVYGT